MSLRMRLDSLKSHLWRDLSNFGGFFLAIHNFPDIFGPSAGAESVKNRKYIIFPDRKKKLEWKIFFHYGEKIFWTKKVSSFFSFFFSKNIFPKNIEKIWSDCFQCFLEKIFFEEKKKNQKIFSMMIFFIPIVFYDLEKLYTFDFSHSQRQRDRRCPENCVLPSCGKTLQNSTNPAKGVILSEIISPTSFSDSYRAK